MEDRRLLLLCERGGFAPLHQAASAAASALAMGQRVDLVLFHGALARFLDGDVDRVDPDQTHAADYVLPTTGTCSSDPHPPRA